MELLLSTITPSPTKTDNAIEAPAKSELQNMDINIALTAKQAEPQNKQN